MKWSNPAPESEMEAQNTGSDNSTTEEESTEEKGRNEFTMRTYDLEVRAESEVSSLDEIAEICSNEMTEMQKIALYGEYQQLETGDDIIEVLFGGQ